MMSQRKVILSMQMTLDGYVASPDGKADWLTDTQETWNEMFILLEQADTFLLGRKMYPEYSAYWQSVLKNPIAKSNELKFAKQAEISNHIVFSRGDFKPDWNNTKVSHNLKAEITNLRAQPGKNIIAWGGADFATSLINLGLVDELRIQLSSTAIGAGKPLFAGLAQETTFQLTDARPMQPGSIILRYNPA